MIAGGLLMLACGIVIGLALGYHLGEDAGARARRKHYRVACLHADRDRSAP